MNELVFVLPSVILCIVFAYLSVKVNKELAPLQFLFLFMCLFFAIITTSTQITLSTVANGTATWDDVYTISQSSNTLAIWGTIATFGIFMVMLIYWMFKKAQFKLNPASNEDEE